LTYEIDAPSNDVIAMNLTIATLDRWLAAQTEARSGEEIGRDIAAIYREIHFAIDEFSGPDEDEEDEDEEEDEDDELIGEGRVAVSTL
jgi:hypothetical protein